MDADALTPAEKLELAEMTYSILVQVAFETGQSEIIDRAGPRIRSIREELVHG